MKKAAQPERACLQIEEHIMLISVGLEMTK